MESIAEWFQTERGINRDTLREFGVTVKNDRVLFPYPNGVKERPNPTRPLADGERRFYFTSGRTPDLFGTDFTSGSTFAFLCEGETDTMRLWQELAGHGDVYGIGGINTWHAGHAQQLAGYDRVYVLLDNDADYLVRAQVDAAWRKIRHDLGGRAKRVALPGHVKDLCEFFAEGNDLELLQELTKQMTVSRFQSVDFTMPPPPVRWLLKDWIAMGDLTVLAGKGGLGKSWLTQALTIAVMNKEESLLDLEVHEHGRVIYVDEENPADVVYSRMLRLGLDTARPGDLRYLWNQGIRLDRDADSLLDEGLEYKPTLYVLDSLSRMHSGEENAAGDVGRILNDSVKPLGRDTGAGVVLIHHHDKNANGPRGTSDIVNAADAVIEVYDMGPANPGKFRMVLTKSRRGPRGAEIIVGIEDADDGTTSLVAEPVLSHLVF